MSAGPKPALSDVTGSPTIPQTARLGPHTVNRVGFGAMQLAGPRVFGPPADAAAARAVLRRTIELGVDHIDTAHFYGPDVVNELIRDALHPYPAGLRIVSKVGARRDSHGGVLTATHPDELRAAVEANLQTLQVDALALVNLRLMGPETRGRIPLAEELGAPRDPPGRGQKRIYRAQQRKRRRGRGRPRDGRPRRGPERLQHQAARRRGRLALLRRSRHRVRPPLPDRLPLHGRAEAACPGPHDLVRRCEAWRDARPDRPCVAPAHR